MNAASMALSAADLGVLEDMRLLKIKSDTVLMSHGAMLDNIYIM